MPLGHTMGTQHRSPKPILIHIINISLMDQSIPTRAACNLDPDFEISTKMATQVNVVDNISGLKALLDELATINISPAPLDAPCLYFDIEGTNLGRNGTIAIISLFVLPKTSTYLIDINTLGSAAFTTKGSQEYTLRGILESPNISKVFFDVRNDSDALFSLFGISLAGVQDLQLMELAANIDGNYPRRYVSGLSKCIEKDLPVTPELKREWLRVKTETKRLFNSAIEDGQNVFDKRPLDSQTIKYCCQDVVYLAELWKVYATKICKPGGVSSFWRYMVRESTMERVELSQSKTYDGQARDKVEGPWYDELVDSELDSWNDDVMDLGVNDNGTLKELSFGKFEWV